MIYSDPGKRAPQYKNNSSITQAVNPMRASTLAMPATNPWRTPVGRTNATSIKANANRKTGANACVWNDPETSPFNNSRLAVVNPQPGQGIPVTARIGQTQPGRPARFKPRCTAPAPTNSRLSRRFSSNWANAGENHAVRKDDNIPSQTHEGQMRYETVPPRGRTV